VVTRRAMSKGGIIRQGMAMRHLTLSAHFRGPVHFKTVMKMHLYNPMMMPMTTSASASPSPPESNKPEKPEKPDTTGTTVLKKKVLKKMVIISGESTDTSKPWDPFKDEKPKEKKPLWDRIKDELHHYWHGTKKLSRNFSIAWRLRLKKLRGVQLTRRDTLELQRNTRDSGKLIPFTIIAVIPFLEFALPVILAIFPDFLPSTYESDRERVSFVLSFLLG
jgi:LETM1 and EF-hand domain-containing protein 1